MDQAGSRKRQRTLRHAAPERVRELLGAYRRRAARDLPAALYATRGRAGGRQDQSSGSRTASAGSSSPPSGTVSSAG
jgi:hypothetical protein